MAEPRPRYRGRFAPSPSGPLHFGSLVAATASFLEARRRGGEWLLRIEDLDPPRVRPGAADGILRALESLGFRWDGPVLRQSTRGEAYAAALGRLDSLGLTYLCPCSRSRLAALPENRRRDAGEELFHPADCAGRQLRLPPPGAVRLRVPDRAIDFEDRCQGRVSVNVARDVGDFVVRRRDGPYAYQLAVVVDDAAQGVTDVVRGVDLLGSTPRQVLLQDALGLPRPGYLHVPLAVDALGAKLSKSGGAAGLQLAEPAPRLVAALEFLGQRPPAGLRSGTVREVWDWATDHWDPQQFAGVATRRADGVD